MKRVLFLGAARNQVASLNYARHQGYYVITCDNRPDNAGHAYAHESHNVSTTDADGVLALAKRLGIDAVVAYASDPAAPTAAYVGNALGLPSNPYESVVTLARKDVFRNFLSRHGFNVPSHRAFLDREEARSFLSELSFPVFVKPVDSSGSKGVTRLEDGSVFDAAFDHALAYSRVKKVIVEEGINPRGYQLAGDGFVVDGQLVFRCFANNHYDRLCNGIVPIGDSFPAVHESEQQVRAHMEIQRVLDLLDMTSGALTFDILFDALDRLYLLELGPRNGGNLTPDVIKLSTGVDLIANTVEAALGNNTSGLEMAEPSGFWASYIVHAIASGCYRKLFLSDRIKPKIHTMDLWAEAGTEARTFLGSNDSLGTMILKFDDMAEMLEMMDNMQRDVCVEFD